MAHPPPTAGLPVSRAYVKPNTENTFYRALGAAIGARPVAP
jgi:hypothetical protein